MKKLSSIPRDFCKSRPNTRCHSERSEESRVFGEILRRFRLLRMTFGYFAEVLLLATFVLLPSPAIAADDPELMNLYRRALEKMERPLKKEDFRHTGLKTARDYDNLAQMCIEAGDYPQALEFTVKALERDAFDPVANLNAGLIHYNQEDYKEAVYYLGWALRIERKLHKMRRVRLGEELLSTSEPPAHLAIMALLERAGEKVSEGFPLDEIETGGVHTAPEEKAETVERTGR